MQLQNNYDDEVSWKDSLAKNERDADINLKFSAILKSFTNLLPTKSETLRKIIKMEAYSSKILLVIGAVCLVTVFAAPQYDGKFFHLARSILRFFEMCLTARARIIRCG